MTIRRKAENDWSIDVILEGTPTRAAVTLLRRGNAVVLIDSGWPRTRTQLVQGLAAHGLEPGQITHVLHTHLHVDHAANHPILPNAILVASSTEFHWADRLYRNLVNEEDVARFIAGVFPAVTGPSLDRAVSFIQVIRRICQGDFFSRWNEIRFYEDFNLPDGLSIVPLPGHTPGHCGILIAGDTPTLVAGDTLTTEDTCLISMPAVDPDQFQVSYRQTLKFRGRIIPGHRPPFDQA
jgi:glyoxylase-like metal-dependent hydrolase (beta-lactamase superfamily II)